ncbi:hypothetical protein CDD83_10687 [Cordyceps sp. RAO-2017]|nr:hypothetical protein CDD83_10687 [Cordyceps sp. RAO-2017]
MAAPLDEGSSASPSPMPSRPPVLPVASCSSSPSAALAIGDKEAAALEGPGEARGGLHPALLIANWMFFSNLTIVFNKWIIDSAGFRYPVFLTCWHLVFSTKLCMTPSLYLRTVCPIGVLYSASLVCSNLAYLYLSVPFIQILKSSSPVAVLLASWAWRLADPSLGTLGNVLFVTAGIAVASVGEIHFSLTGFLYQIGGLVFGAVQLVMTELMLGARSLHAHPLVSLYYYAPVCAGTYLAVALVVELPVFDWADLVRVGPGMLLLNAMVAFALNFAGVFLISKTSSLVMALAGILKNILLIAASALIWKTQVTAMQAAGYSMALSGLVYYSFGYAQLAEAAQAVNVWTAAGLRPLRGCRLLLVGLVVLVALSILWIHGAEPRDGALPTSSAGS